MINAETLRPHLTITIYEGVWTPLDGSQTRSRENGTRIFPHMVVVEESLSRGLARPIGDASLWLELVPPDELKILTHFLDRTERDAVYTFHGKILPRKDAPIPNLWVKETLKDDREIWTVSRQYPTGNKGEYTYSLWLPQTSGNSRNDKESFYLLTDSRIDSLEISFCLAQNPPAIPLRTIPIRGRREKTAS